jgi:mono/diheme cytochrome c family protein
MTLAILMAASAAQAELKLIGTGATMQADISGYPPNLKAAYEIFKVKCLKCHGLDRTLLTIQSGVSPSGSTFDAAAVDAYGAKMLRKPDAEMTRQEVKVVNELLKYMLDEAAK